MSMLSFLAGANFHVLRKDKVDLYLGPQVGFVGYGDFETVDGDAFGVKNGLALGAVIGVDVPLGGSKWVFSSSLQYLSTDADVEGDVEWDLDDTLPVDPIVLKIGAGYRF
jgi:outer membrane protein W